MLVSRIVSLISLALASSALSTSFFTSNKLGGQARLKPADDDPPNNVPGENPLEFCAEPTEYLLNITHVDLDPNTPKP
jgi:hypothetical protein